jgi:hypothetical protein
MAIGTTHPAFKHRMVMGELKLRTHFQVALETRFGGSARINNRVRRSAALDVQTSRPMARFAANVLGVFSLCF